MSSPLEQIELARRALRGQRATELTSYGGVTPIAPAPPRRAAPLYSHAVINLATAGNYVVIPGTPGLQCHIFAGFVWSEKDQNLELFSGAVSLSGLLKAWPLQQGILLPFTGEPWFECADGQPFKLSISANGQMSGWLQYRYV